MPITKADDLAMVNNPNNWPKWPVLPVKSRHEKDETGFPKLGIILDGMVDDFSHRVYECNMLMLPKDQAGWDALPRHDYASADELIEHWMVD